MVEINPQYEDHIRILGLMSMIRWRTKGQPDCQLNTVLDRGGLNADLIEQGVLTSPAEDLHEQEIRGVFDIAIDRCVRDNHRDLLYRVLCLKQTVQYDPNASFTLRDPDETPHHITELEYLTNPTTYGYDPNSDGANLLNGGGRKFSQDQYTVYLYPPNQQGSAHYFLRNLVEPPRNVELPARTTNDNWCLTGMVRQLIAMLPGNAQSMRGLIDQLGPLFQPETLQLYFDKLDDQDGSTALRPNIVNHQLERPRTTDTVTTSDIQDRTTRYQKTGDKAMPNFPGRSVGSIARTSSGSPVTGSGLLSSGQLATDIFPWVDELVQRLQAFRDRESICGDNTPEVPVPPAVNQVLALCNVDPMGVANHIFSFILPESMDGGAARLLRQVQNALSLKNLQERDQQDLIYQTQRAIVEELKAQREYWGDDLLTNVYTSLPQGGQINRMLQNISDYRSIIELRRHPVLGHIIDAMLTTDSRTRIE